MAIHMMNMGNHVAFEDIEQGKDGWKKINEIFRGYLTDDVALALDAGNREQLRNVGNKAKDLRFFKDILSEKTLSEINKMIEKNNAQIDKLFNRLILSFSVDQFVNIPPSQR